MLFFHEAQQLLPSVAFESHSVADIRSVESGDEMLGVAEIQPGDNFFSSALIGCRGQCDAGNVGEPLVQQAQLEVICPKIMAPLGHAVRFIDSEQSDRCLL